VANYLTCSAGLGGRSQTGACVRIMIRELPCIEQSRVQNNPEVA
jgi:hypothetical protein